MSESKDSVSLGRVTLHVWPAHDDLLSFDVSSLAALLYLQLAIPAHFSLIHCPNPDLSPAGQLPFLTHRLHHVSGLDSIIAHIRKQRNARNLDDHLDPMQIAQLTARVAHVESSYGDLVNHMLYSLQENWSAVTRPALVSVLPVPQCYYVPSRIRTSHKARLEAAELWHVPEAEEEEPDEPRSVLGRRRKHRPANEPQKFKTVFEREKAAEKARALFDVYDRLLGDQRFFMGSDAPTSLDVVFAAHTHFLLSLKFPDPLVTSVLTESYPRFVAHSKAVFSAALPNPSLLPPVQKNSYASLRCLIPWPRAPTRRSLSTALANSPEAQREEWRFQLWRWGFIGVSLLAVGAAHLHLSRSSMKIGMGKEIEEVAEDAEG